MRVRGHEVRFPVPAPPPSFATDLVAVVNRWANRRTTDQLVAALEFMIARVKAEA